jgi:hypothetical protein
VRTVVRRPPSPPFFSFALKLQAFSFTEMIWSGEVL